MTVLLLVCPSSQSVPHFQDPSLHDSAMTAHLSILTSLSQTDSSTGDFPLAESKGNVTGI